MKIYKKIYDIKNIKLQKMTYRECSRLKQIRQIKFVI